MRATTPLLIAVFTLSAAQTAAAYSTFIDEFQITRGTTTIFADVTIWMLISFDSRSITQRLEVRRSSPPGSSSRTVAS